MKNERVVATLPAQRRPSPRPVVRTGTRQEQLLALDSKQARGELCLKWAEEARRTIEREMRMRLPIEIAKWCKIHRRHEKDLSNQELQAIRINTEFAYKNSARFKSLVGDDQMYSRWADSYNLAHLAEK